MPFAITGVPPTPAVALSAVRTAKAVAGERAVSGLTWGDVERLGAQHQGGVSALLHDLRLAGLEGLAELALDFCVHHLKPGGDLLIKVFMGSGFEELRTAMRAVFTTVAVRKPSASRDRSAETYLLARGKRVE